MFFSCLSPAHITLTSLFNVLVLVYIYFFVYCHFFSLFPHTSVTRSTIPYCLCFLYFSSSSSFSLSIFIYILSFLFLLYSCSHLSPPSSLSWPFSFLFLLFLIAMPLIFSICLPLSLYSIFSVPSISFSSSFVSFYLFLPSAGHFPLYFLTLLILLLLLLLLQRLGFFKSLS